MIYMEADVMSILCWDINLNFLEYVGFRYVFARSEVLSFEATLTIYQIGAHYSGIKIFHNLPLEVKNVPGNPKKFPKLLRNNFYTLTLFIH
jgi:hypothetical protein